MLARHHKELEHIRKVNQSNEENLLRALTIDRKGLPKSLRSESKTRGIMYRELLRINLPVKFFFFVIKIKKIFRVKV